MGSYTVYKKVVQYEAMGLVTSKTTKNRNMLEKTVYALTSEGKTKFKELMTEYSLRETQIFLAFNAVIVNLALLDDKSIEKLVSNIRESIHNTKRQITNA